MSVRRAVALVLAAVFVPLAAALPAAANHAQAEQGKVIVFDHKESGANEWWVEAVLSGQDAGSVQAVWAQDTGGPLVAMKKTSYGSWSASFHIEPGNEVRFRADWAGGAQVHSCWFTHPAGAETCAAPPPPPPPPPGTWVTTQVGENRPYGYSGDMAMADIDADGRRDIVVGRANGMVTYEWVGTSGAAWQKEAISPRLFDTIAAGDADNDGTSEAYGMAVSSPGTELLQYRKVNGLWQQTTLLAFTETLAGDMTLGNIDGVAGTEIYVAMVVTTCDPDPNVPLCSSESTVYLVRADPSGWPWTKQAIATVGGHVDSMWIGDGDNNGRFELYVGHGTRHADRATQIQQFDGQWVQHGLSGTGSGGGFALVVVGDGDRDGRNEVYQANYEGSFLKHSYDPATGWSNEFLFGFSGGPDQASALFLGDGDGDGSQELYLTTDAGELYRIRWTGTAWDATVISHPDDPFGRGKGSGGVLVVGDGDGDGKREVYTTFAFLMPNTGEDGVDRTYKVALVPPTFDATFTGVRGNEWWVQANVAATGGTLSKVDVRLNGGAWQPLSKQSWGGWAKSLHIVQGTTVQLRATSTTGATDLSDCYRWIPPSNTDAAKVACGTSPPPPPPGFDATFTGVKGNEWWVQATVSANEPIAAVHARVDCGAWVALENQGWGWAKSFHVPDGAKVVFRATSHTGATDLSGGYTWPSATPTTGC